MASEHRYLTRTEIEDIRQEVIRADHPDRLMLQVGRLTRDLVAREKEAATMQRTISEQKALLDGFYALGGLADGK